MPAHDEVPLRGNAGSAGTVRRETVAQVQHQAERRDLDRLRRSGLLRVKLRAPGEENDEDKGSYGSFSFLWLIFSSPRKSRIIRPKLSVTRTSG